MRHLSQTDGEQRREAEGEGLPTGTERDGANGEERKNDGAQWKGRERENGLCNLSQWGGNKPFFVFGSLLRHVCIPQAVLTHTPTHICQTFKGSATDLSHFMSHMTRMCVGQIHTLALCSLCFASCVTVRCWFVQANGHAARVCLQ